MSCQDEQTDREVESPLCFVGLLNVAVSRQRCAGGGCPQCRNASMLMIENLELRCLEIEYLQCVNALLLALQTQPDRHCVSERGCHRQSERRVESESRRVDLD